MQSQLVKKRLLTSVISAPLALALLTTVLLWHLQTERSYSRSLIDTRHLVSAARSLKSRVEKTQFAFEDYLLSGAQADLSGLRQALTQTEVSLRNLLSSASGEARTRLAEVKDREARWSGAIQDLIIHGSAPRPAVAANGRIKPLTRAVLSSLDNFTDSQTRFLHGQSVREHD